MNIEVLNELIINNDEQSDHYRKCITLLAVPATAHQDMVIRKYIETERMEDTLIFLTTEGIKTPDETKYTQSHLAALITDGHKNIPDALLRLSREILLSNKNKASTRNAYAKSRFK